MRVEVTPQTLIATPGVPQPITVTVTNTTDVIGGYAIRFLGADPEWVYVEQESLSLFPATSETVQITLTAPASLPAGHRRMAVQVRELTAPHGTVVTDIELDVPANPGVMAQLDPGSVTGGRKATFALSVANHGNTTVAGRLVGSDPEEKVEFDFSPRLVAIPPGEQISAEVRVSARRRLVGSLAVRTFGVHVASAGAASPADADGPTATGASSGRARHAKNEAPADPPPDGDPLATGVFLQKPVFSRGAISLAGLLAAISVFAIVITVALSGVVGRSAADRDLALQVAQARDQGNSGGGSASISGTVKLLTSGNPVPGVTVDLFDSSDVANPITTTATGADGAYHLPGLAAGDYKVRFRGAGFTELWYPDALDDTGAKDINVQAGQSVSGADVVLGGLPASISGTVVGTDVSGAKVELRIPGGAGGTSGGAQAAADQNGGSASASEAPGAVVRTVPVGSDGLFAIASVPSPSVYDVVVSKAGYATATQRIDLGGGEQRKGIEIQLRQGDGLISGHVTGPQGPIGGATVSATYGNNRVSTVSLTQDDVGAFTLRDLPTPEDFSIVVSSPGLASTSLTVNLSANQKLTGVDVALSAASGSLGGVVTTLADGKPAPGVSVQVTNGSLTVNTVTQSMGSVGSWTVGGLPIPSDYTVTFSRGDLAPQTVSVSLDANGVASVGSADAISVSMKSSTAVLKGTASQRSGAAGQPSAPIGGVSITLSSADHTYAVATATTPAGGVGGYEIDGVAPGTYTLSFSRKGTAPTSTIINLAAGETRTYNPELVAAASIAGVVTDAAGNPARGVQVKLYVATDYPDTSELTAALDANGHYEFDNVDAPRQYVIEVAAVGTGQPLRSQAVALEASQQLIVNFTLGPGAIPTGGPTQAPTSNPPSTAPPSAPAEPSGPSGDIPPSGA